MSFVSFWSDALATILGGLALAVIIFFVREKVFAPKNVTGRWYFEIVTRSSVYQPFLGMRLCYIAVLCRDANRLFGTAEKIFESSSTGDRHYVGSSRTRSLVEGYVQHNYFGPDRIYLHIVESGLARESTNFQDLEFHRNGQMSGLFCSMVADQDGEARWQRRPLPM